MFYVVQVQQNLEIGPIQEVETLEAAIAICMQVMEENGINTTVELCEAVENHYGYVHWEHGTGYVWAVQIGIIG